VNAWVDFESQVAHGDVDSGYCVVKNTCEKEARPRHVAYVCGPDGVVGTCAPRADDIRPFLITVRISPQHGAHERMPGSLVYVSWWDTSPSAVRRERSRIVARTVSV
jgi:hypothetical protein